MKVSFYKEIEKIEDKSLIFSVIVARHKGKWVFCKHKDRDTLECPGGTREVDETIMECAIRELKEETGAIDFSIEPVCVYSVIGKTKKNPTGEETFGILCKANIETFSELHSEMEKILPLDTLPDNYTYPLIQPYLIEYVLVQELVNNFYVYLSFTDSSKFQAAKLCSLFIKNAELIKADKHSTIENFIDELNSNIRDDQKAYKEGLTVKQLNYTFDKDEDIIKIESFYVKQSYNATHYGCHQIKINKYNGAYKIIEITFA